MSRHDVHFQHRTPLYRPSCYIKFIRVNTSSQHKAPRFSHLQVPYIAFRHSGLGLCIERHVDTRAQWDTRCAERVELNASDTLSVDKV